MSHCLCNVLYIPACLVSHIGGNHSPTPASTRQGKGSFFRISEEILNQRWVFGWLYCVSYTCIVQLWNQTSWFTCKTIFVTHRRKVVVVFMPFNIVRWRKVGRVRFWKGSFIVTVQPHVPNSRPTGSLLQSSSHTRSRSASKYRDVTPPIYISGGHSRVKGSLTWDICPVQAPHLNWMSLLGRAQVNSHLLSEVSSWRSL